MTRRLERLRDYTFLMLVIRGKEPFFRGFKEVDFSRFSSRRWWDTTGPSIPLPSDGRRKLRTIQRCR